MRLRRPLARRRLGPISPGPIGLGLAVGVMLFAGGCSRFSGEWVEKGTGGGAAASPMRLGTRPLALKFLPPATVRSAVYNPNTGYVDPESVQESQYVTLDHRRVAQFGVLTARVEGDQLLVQGSDGDVRRLTRVRNGSVFPPPTSFARSTPAADQPVGPVRAVPGGVAMGGPADSAP